MICVKDVEIKFIRGSGRGGQKINKTSVCVQLKHLPTGIIIECQETRSQAKNREIAQAELERRLKELEEKKAFKRKQAKEKERRRKRKRPFKVKQEILKSKRHRSKIKSSRKKPSMDD